MNAALINHSCSPNAAVDLEEKSNHGREIRAIKAIKKGEEITTFYIFYSHDHFRFRQANIAIFGCTSEERRITIKRDRGFDCKCGMCCGNVEYQEDIMRQLSELYKALDSKHDQKKASEYSASDWTKDAKIWAEIVDKTLKLHIGGINAKISSVSLLAVTAQFARDQKLLEKAKDILKRSAEDAKIEFTRIGYGTLEKIFTTFSNKLILKKPPKKKPYENCNRPLL